VSMKVAGMLCALLLWGCTQGRSAKPNVTPVSAAPTSSNAAASDLPQEECFLPLEMYCRNRRCQSYTVSAAETRRYGSSNSCLVAAIGTCDGLRFTTTGDGFASRTEYFDRAGKLVAARTTTDVVFPFSACPGWTHFGQPLACSESTTLNYCAK
jgi:hypothetical protein